MILNNGNANQENKNDTQFDRLSSLPQNQGSWYSAIVDYAGCRLTPVMRLDRQPQRVSNF